MYCARTTHRQLTQSVKLDEGKLDTEETSLDIEDWVKVRLSEERRTGGAKDRRSEATTVYYYGTITNTLLLVTSLLALIAECHDPF